MIMDELAKGFVAITDKEGLLKRIINYNMNIPFKKGEPFSQLIDTGSKAKSSIFMDKLIDGNAIFDWEMNIKIKDKIKTFHFSGYKVNNEIFIVGAENRSEMIKIYKLLEEDMPLTKPKTLNKTKDEKLLFDELTHLNNQLTLAKRELIKKNLELKKALQEKEMLIREINHRVKNDLMIISSLLNLQAKYVKDKDDLILFKEAQTRAKSMAMLHEKLYQSGKYRSIEFGEYLKGLLKDLYYAFVTQPGKIGLEMDIESRELDVRIAMPLALIINELFTNAIKHAFPGDRKGTIRVEFKKKGGFYSLKVSDDGIGLPEDFNLDESKTFGLSIVNALTKQINGELSLHSNNGTTFNIRFKEQQ